VGASLTAAFALMLVLEGLLPFFSPATWRDAFRRAADLNDGQLRMMGLGSMLAGLGLLAIAL
jgi:uncharacterized protein